MRVQMMEQDVVVNCIGNTGDIKTGMLGQMRHVNDRAYVTEDENQGCFS